MFKGSLTVLRLLFTAVHNRHVNLTHRYIAKHLHQSFLLSLCVATVYKQCYFFQSHFRSSFLINSILIQFQLYFYSSVRFLSKQVYIRCTVRDTKGNTILLNITVYCQFKQSKCCWNDILLEKIENESPGRSNRAVFMIAAAVHRHNESKVSL